MVTSPASSDPSTEPVAPYPTYRAGQGMVCAVDHLAAGAGVDMLRRGGSAADAAVATSAVLAVTTQHMCGMGGDLLAVVCLPPSDGERRPPAALVASGRAGSGADPERLRAEGRTTMPFRGDIRSTPVPGCVDGWLALHDRFGRLPLSEVLAPAVSYARDGFPVSPTLAGASRRVAGVPDAGPFDPAEPLRVGQRLIRPGVAAALEAIVSSGRDGFYGGAFGRGLLELGAGEFTAEDLSRGQADWCDAVTVELPGLGLRLWTTPPPTQGYLTLAAAWMAAGIGMPPDPDSAEWAHLLVEASRQAAYDRPDVLHEGADGTALVDPVRLEPRRRAIDARRSADLAGSFAAGGTIGLCAVDSERMGVSLLQSNASGFGVHIVEPQTGIFLHNRGIGFNLIPGHPAEYGPGRRPPHTLSPLGVTADGSDDLVGVMASMGGDSQPQVLLQLLARVFGAGQGPGRAVAAGRFTLSGADSEPGSDGFATWGSGGRVVVELERHAPAGWDAGLRERGHSVRRSDDRWGASFGHAHVIRVEGDHLAGATDPRPRAGAAAGY